MQLTSAYNYLYNVKKKSIETSKDDDTLNYLKNNIPPKLKEFMECKKMYQIIYGGRSSAKTRTALHKLLIRATEKSNQTILCTREFQSSISTSTYAELKQIIYENNLLHIFDVKHDSIICNNGTKFIFKGLVRDIATIKSTPNISVCFVEEAETIKREIWETLDPTLRKDGCELIILFNPKDKRSATYQKWLIEPIAEEDILRIEINYHENPYNSPLILKKIERMKEYDYARYEHIYLGKLLDISEDVIFKGRFKILHIPIEFINGRFIYEGKTIAPLYGMDFGFSVDPAAMVEVFFLNEDSVYIRKEIYKTGLLPNNDMDKENDYAYRIEKDLGKYALNSEWNADSSRPDTIAQLNRGSEKTRGIKVIAAPKPKGSIEAGIDYLKGKNIIIDPACENMVFEAYEYKYKIDKNSEQITTEIIDKHNHGWDAIRYALWKQIAAMNQRDFSFNPNVLQQLGIA